MREGNGSPLGDRHGKYASSRRSSSASRLSSKGLAVTGGRLVMREDHLKSIATTWAQRAQAELGAERKFRLLTEQLADLGANNTVISLAKKAQQDEHRHAVMCAQVARKYGHSTGFEDISASSIPVHKNWSQREWPEDRLLCEVTLMCCIIETLNASLLNSIYGASPKNSTQKIIHEILKDEVKHSQIGWAHLTSETQKRDCSFLGDYLDEMLEVSIGDELFVPIPENLDETDSFQYGVLPVALRWDQFKETIEQVVFPGFEKFGINTLKGKEWLKKKTAP